MTLENNRLSKRLNLKASIIEKVFSLIAEIDSIKNSWKITNRLLPQTIKRLNTNVIVTSTGASNRIEGNKLSDSAIEALYKNNKNLNPKTRDEQEVAGYIETLELIFDNYNEIRISESFILQLHKDMLKYCEKDERHRGEYKFSSNRVEARDGKGNVVGVIFEPTPPHLTQKEIHELVSWYSTSEAEKLKHPLILIANFIFEYLAIHPFQDGNGRTSRLLTNLMLLKSGYDFTSVVSHEKIIEEKKSDYYLALNKTQKSWKTDDENISEWLLFFLEVVKEQSVEALNILQGDDIEHLLSEKQLELWHWILENNNSSFSRKDAIEALGFPSRTVESIIKKLLDLKKLEKIGQGRATRYKVAK